ncbi:membrane protein [Salmonella bongori]|nr:membrane protein [Salmonella bongori]
MKPVKRSALTLFLAVLSSAAVAHPHSFIRLQTQVVSENPAIRGVKNALDNGRVDISGSAV